MTRTAGELAKYLGAKLEGDPLTPISGVASPSRAGSEDLIYVDSPRHEVEAAYVRREMRTCETRHAAGGEDDSRSE